MLGSKAALIVGFTWSWKRRVADIAMLADSSVRVERVSCGQHTEDHEAFTKAMTLLSPRAGFDLVLHDRCDDPGLGELLEENQGALEALAKKYGMRSCERPSMVEIDSWAVDAAFVNAVVRRRGMSASRCAILGPDAVELFVFDPRRPQSNHVSATRSAGEWTSPGTIESAISDIQSQSALDSDKSTWLVVGPDCGPVATGLAAITDVRCIVIPSHAGASTAVGLLVGDLRRAHHVSFNESRPLLAGDTGRLREAFLELMDQASAEATRLGFDTDDLVCEKYVEISHSGGDTITRISCDRFLTVEEIFDYFVELRRASGAADFPNQAITGASVHVTIETPKQRLPSVALSSTIPGAGEPVSRVVIGPGKMLACLCEIDVPAGWQAVWEPSGDVVMTRV